MSYLFSIKKEPNTLEKNTIDTSYQSNKYIYLNSHLYTTWYAKSLDLNNF